jgi:tetratricopeptide (TPR) repeat protein
MAILIPKGSDSYTSPRMKPQDFLLVVSAVLLLASCISITEDPALQVSDGPTPVAPVVELIPEEEDVYTAMSEAMLLGDVDEAISAFEDAYSKDPEDSETQILYANLLMAAGEIEEAKLVLQEVLRGEPENTDALYNLSLVEGMMGDKERQEEILISIVAIDPEYIQAHASLGELRLSSGQFGPARESFEKALSFDEGNLVALMGYGNVLLRDDEAGLAIEQFDKVIEQVPDYVFAYVDRSRARKDEGDYRGAETDLGEAIKREPGYYWHYIDRGRLRLLSMGDPDSALEDFVHAIDIDPDFFYAYVFRGGIHDQAGDNPRAIEDYLKVLAARPDYYHLYAPVSVLLYSEERFREARKYLKMAYEYSKDEHFFAFLIALSFRKEGLESDMETYLKRAIVNFPRESLYYRLARIFFESGSDGFVTGEVSREQDLDLKLKALFVLATHNLLENRPVLAQKYFLEVEDKAYPSSYERRLSSMELERYRGKGSE